MIPARTEFYNPILKSLTKLRRPSSIQEIERSVERLMRLSPQVRSVPHKAGENNKPGKYKTEVSYRMDWARTNLKKFGLLENISRGTWALTKKGASMRDVDPRQVIRFVNEQARQNRLANIREGKNIRRVSRLPRSARPSEPHLAHDPRTATLPKLFSTVERIWRALEKQRAQVPRKEIHAERIPVEQTDLFAGLTPEGNRMLYLECEIDRQGEVLRGAPYYSLRAERPWAGSSGANGRLNFRQKTPAGKDDFTNLAKKVLRYFVSASEKNAETFVASVKEGLRELRENPSQKLGEEAERGLIGEICFLLTVIPKVGLRKAIFAWHGPKGLSKDFWFDDRAVEVKTSLLGAEMIFISSPEQLYSEEMSNLFLFYLPLERRPRGGKAKTLPGYVREVRKQIDGDTLLQNEFNARLSAAPADERYLYRKYRDEDENKYTDRYYACEKDFDFFRVGKGFPRLDRQDLIGRGISVKEYKIDLSVCKRDFSEKASLLQWNESAP